METDDTPRIATVGASKLVSHRAKEIQMRLKPTLALAWPLALLLSTAVLTMLSTTASADPDENTEWKFKEQYQGADKSTCVIYQDPNSKWLLVEIWKKDGTVSVTKYKPSGDPGPDDNSNKGLEVPDIAAMLAKSKIAYKVTVNPENTPLSKLITGDGFGLGPHGNPGDQDTNNGPTAAPVRTETVSKTAAEIKLEIRTLNQIARDLQSLATSMGSGDEGAGETAPGFNRKNNGNNGGGVDKNGNYTEHRNKTIGKTESLGPFPQLVNPPPKNKLKVSGQVPATIPANAGVASRGMVVSAKVIGAGLLEGGTGLSSQGPAATGHALAIGGPAATALGGMHGPAGAAIR
jgi:hypothetical protein